MSKSAALMTWVPAGRRWIKHYGGTTYAVSCRQLGCPPTRHASAGLANAWWLARQRELDAAAPPAPGTGRTLSERREDWIAMRRLDAAVEPRKRSAVAQIAECLDDWQRWADGHGVTAVTGGVAEGYFASLQRNVVAGRWSVATAAKVWARFKQFLGYLEDVDAGPVPRIVRRLRFVVPAVRPTIIDPVPYVNAAGPRLRLYYLLMLNCGMYQSDIACLRRDEVDLSAGGTITRRRSKTGHRGTPEVTYPLWSVTSTLLHKLMERGGELALLTAGGNPVAVRVSAEGRRYDTIQGMHLRLCTRLGVPRVPLKLFRKASADRLDKSPYARFVPMFLAHSPRSIAERHYLGGDAVGFAEAVRWLGGQFATDVADVPAA